MFTKEQKKIKIIFGKLNLLGDINKIFDERILDFFDEISKEIINNKKSSNYKDLATFAFWCRKANLLKISQEYNKKDQMIGRGLALHITPSNVPMNFAYSLAFGLLSGNNNIVRLPSKKFFQVNIICKLFYKILQKKKYFKISKKICLINYEKSNEISSALSKIVDVRLIWGGDETINQFKKYYTSPRCVDLNFANRYSISIINIKKISKLSRDQLANIARRFFNDSYTMDQKGCSSPQAIVWIGGNNKKIKKKFFNSLEEIVNKEYDNDLSVTNDKIAALSLIAVKSNANFKTNYNNFKLIRIDVKSLTKEIENIQPHFGTFVEIDLSNIGQINKIISKKLQTITYFGINESVIKNAIVKKCSAGVDRIVPIGRALDMGVIWDGYDVIQALSRTIGK
tara:strand:- start:45 stop:1238 length:1194 start_codon:yes stop_codon:yes gene_type:complete